MWAEACYLPLVSLARPMKKPTASLPTHLRQAATVSQLLAFATIGLAQAVPVPAPPADEITVLTPFPVATNQDRGYRATSTLSPAA